MKKILVVAFAFVSCAGSVFGREASTLTQGETGSFPTSTYEVDKNAGDRTNDFMYEVKDISGDELLLKRIPVVREKNGCNENIANSMGKLGRNLAVTKVENTVSNSTRDIYFDETKKTPIETKSWLDVVEASVHVSRIALGSTVLAGSAVLKGVCWTVYSAPWLIPASAMLKHTSWASSPWLVPVFSLSTCFSKLCKFVVPKFFVSAVDGIPGADKVVSVVHRMVNSVEKSAELSDLKCSLLQPDSCANKLWSSVCKKLIEEKSYIGNMQGDLMYTGIGWIGSFAVKHYAGSIVNNINSLSSSGIKFGYGQVLGGFRDLRDMRYQ